ncbi:MAG TPA: hypothetical protein VE011_08305 [Candidatus Dormibacteraeota bacterium]|nr:hypothetical protein [Candidatus Dormibacteraeota bacterium]
MEAALDSRHLGLCQSGRDGDHALAQATIDARHVELPAEIDERSQRALVGLGEGALDRGHEPIVNERAYRPVTCQFIGDISRPSICPSRPSLMPYRHRT